MSNIDLSFNDLINLMKFSFIKFFQAFFPMLILLSLDFIFYSTTLSLHYGPLIRFMGGFFIGVFNVVIIAYLCTVDEKSIIKQLTAPIQFVLSNFNIVFIPIVLKNLIIMGGFFLLIIPGIYLYFRLLTFDYIIIFEQANFISAFNKSSEQSKGIRLKVFGVHLLLTLIISIITVIAYISAGFLQVFDSTTTSSFGAIMSVLSGSLIGKLLSFFSCLICLTLVGKNKLTQDTAKAL